MYSGKWKEREMGVQEFTNGMEDAIQASFQMGQNGEDLETSQGQSISQEVRCHQALILNMSEILRDKVQ